MKLSSTSKRSFFIYGLLLSCAVMLLVYSFSPVEFNLLQGFGFISIAIVSGIFASLWGVKFIDAFMKTLDSSGF